MNEEEAIHYIIHYLRNPTPVKYTSYGYDFYLPGIIQLYAEKHEGIVDEQELYRRKIELSPFFYAAAWELCRRGIIRPGIRAMGLQSTPDGSAGNGYSITPFGRTWLNESDRDDYIPTEPGRFSQMLRPFQDDFGPGFYERAQQAVRCYGAHAYLACCAMCGAAAESILLAIATKKKNEYEVLKIYRSSQGRSKIENIIIGQAKKQIQIEFRGFTVLLKYWRDEAAHGRTSGIADNEAYTSLALLLRFAYFVKDNLDEILKING